METFQCAVVTGASSGIGREFAHQLAPNCEHLVLVARRESYLNELKGELESRGLRLHVHIVVADLTSAAERESVLRATQEAGLRVDLLVNNAGMGDYGEFRSADWDKTAAMIELNMMALTHLCHLFLPQMIARQSGGIINVSSLASTLPIPDFAVYAATKAYVSSFSEALRIELKDFKIPVVALCPGPVHTEFGSVANRNEGDSSFGAQEMFYVDQDLVVRKALDGLKENSARVFPGMLVAGAALLIGALPLCAVRLMMANRPRRAGE